MVLGVSHALAAALAPLSSPFLAVGAAAVDATPEPVKDFAVRTFGERDKLVLLAGMAVVIATLAAGIGIAARRRPAVGYWALALLGAVGCAAALGRPGSSPAWALPAVVGTLTGLGAFALLFRPEDSEDGTVRIGRRRLLGVFAGAGAAGLAGWAAGGATDVEKARRDVVLPEPASPAPQAEGIAREGLTPYLTPAEDFYRVDTALSVPRIDPDDYVLRIGGRVGRPLEYTYRQLLDMPLIERDVTLSCVSNEIGGTLAGNARWLGVRLSDLLDLARPEKGADQLVSRSADGWTCGTPAADCRDGRDAMLAVGMNGRPLPVEHGFPVRMIVPGHYGYVSATKWLTEIELSSFGDFDAYWTRRGWAERTDIKTASRIDTPRSKARQGAVAVAGVAWAQHRGISAVEVQVDDGPWNEADLAPVTSDDTWRQWVWEWRAEPGEHLLRVRATDGEGDLQEEEESEPFPSGATGLHTVRVTVAE